MNKTTDLTKGSILNSLLSLALPIMGTSFIQMAYGMIDMIWIGRVSSLAVAAVGTAGFLVWFGQSFILLSKVGAEICVSQYLGAKKEDEARSFANNAMQITIIMALIYSLIMIIFKKQIIGFFRLNSLEVIQMSETYLVIVSIGMIFNFVNPVLTGIFNGAGNSKVPFLVNTVGLIFNIIFDPILIFGIGPIPKLGVAGAAIATVLAQVIVTCLFLLIMKKQDTPLFKINIFAKLHLDHVKKLIKLGFPVAVENGLFSFFAMLIGRIVASHGDAAVAVQQVGSQIEAISWMTAGGFCTALGTFVGQNYGARKYERIVKGYFVSMCIVSVIGLFSTLLLTLGSKFVFSIFISESKTLGMGITYLKIVGLSQFFMCIEITTAGAFNGIGRTTLPAIVSGVFNALRIPSAIILSKPEVLGLNGVWWSISVSSMFKGIVLVSLFIILVVKNKDFKNSLKASELLEEYN
ncbi:MATE family efflux transporter [Hathewaya massiliensis]|uniref:MATE family efflux transporter n=1 Tax=Hathewaya massiliensis TaxID=1964382 RepID=UPI001A9B722C|nr:MATE family efflux transporter [Hathewaya massiliensis]